jgi:uncharacterized protein YkwD
MVAEVVRLVNVERARAGLPALSGNNSGLNSAATVRAGELVTLFSHTRPNGTSWSTVLGEYNITGRSWGENIAWGQDSAQSVMNSWMNSQGHRNNIMGDYTHIGVGVVRNGNTLHWVQLFMKS